MKSQTTPREAAIEYGEITECRPVKRSDEGLTFIPISTKCEGRPELTGQEHGRIDDDVSESKSPSGCDGPSHITISKKPKLLEAGHPDNFQTPASALDCLLPYLNKKWTIWEPACGKGNLVYGLQDHGYKVFGSDILNSPFQDFLSYAGFETFDCIVTNPPFSIKEKFLSRCYELGEPFALLMPITTFDSRERRKLFHRNGVQLILPNGRVNFETPNNKGSSSWFYTAWFTHGLDLPNQLNFHGLEMELV